MALDRCYCVLFLATVWVVAHSFPAAKQKFHRDVDDGRLPNDVIPRNYKLEVRPDIYTSTAPPFPFSGTVEIYITCVNATRTIVLNEKSIDYTSLSVVADLNSPVPTPSPILRTWSFNPISEFLTLEVVNDLVPQAWYIIRLSFAGELRSDGLGLHWDSYVDEFGATKYLAATQMFAHEARSVFPCFDEPHLKATFDVTIVSKAPHVTLSNMPLNRTEDRADGWVANIFQTTPVMSTYLLNFAIGDFVAVEAQWQNVTTYPVTIYGRPQVADKLAFAARVAPLLQAWLEQETGIPYPLPKMDHIALPSFGGAMENWGLIMYNEYYLCVDRQTSSSFGIFTVASVISHELAHQWFGNLVTPQWWNDVWLSEGFATYFNYYPQAALNWPASELHQIDFNRGIQQFLDIDQLNTSDPIRKQIDNVWQAYSSLAGSTYPKGGAVLRMLRSILSYPTFKQGLTNYLTKYSYGNAVTDDLWAELTAQAAADGITLPDGSALDVKEIMDAWLNQMGYPILVLTRNGDGTATVSSRRYLSPRGQSPDTPSDYNYWWNIPITAATRLAPDTDTTPYAYIPYGQTTVTVPNVPTTPGDWIIINVKQKSFYRVDYDGALRDEIVAQLNTDHSVIPVESRAQFLDDSFTVARTLNLPLTFAMDATLYLKNELLYNPWAPALKHLRYIDRFFFGELWYTLYRGYIVDQLYEIYFNVGWNYSDLESPLQQYLRRDVITNICYYGNEDCRSVARNLYATFKANPSANSIHPNNLATVLCVGVSEGFGADWSLVFEQYLNRKSSPIREERYVYLFGLACSSDTAWHDRLLSYIIGGNLISPRDANTALLYMTQSRVGLPIVYYYLSNSWNTVPSFIDKFAALESITSTFYEPYRSTEFNNFVGTYPPRNQAELERYRRIDLTLIQNYDFTLANYESLQQWLADLPSNRTSERGSLVSQLPLSSDVYWKSLEPFEKI